MKQTSPTRRGGSPSGSSWIWIRQCSQGLSCSDPLSCSNQRRRVALKSLLICHFLVLSVFILSGLSSGSGSDNADEAGINRGDSPRNHLWSIRLLSGLSGSCLVICHRRNAAGGGVGRLVQDNWPCLDQCHCQLLVKLCLQLQNSMILRTCQLHFPTEDCHY